LAEKFYEKTLIDEEIDKWAKSENWIVCGGIYENFDEKNVHGETYDLRAGDLIIIGEPDGKRNYISLKDQREVVIEPFKSATVQTLEKIKLPLDMYGELWIRNALQHQGLAFTGGDIDPGYWGHLYIKLHNVGPVPVRIGYQKEIASLRFVKMSRPAKKSYTMTEIIKPRDEQLPPCPPRMMYDWLQLSTKLDDLKLSLSHIQRFHDHFVIGVVAGLVTGLILLGIEVLLRFI
jgi:dCTP deaminase